MTAGTGAPADWSVQEHSAARKVALGPLRIPVAVAGVVVLTYLVLPYSGELKGFDVLLYTAGAHDFGVNVLARVWAWLALIAGILIIAEAATERLALALAGSFFGGLGAVAGMFATWVRQVRADGDLYGAGYGVIICAVALVVATIMMVLGFLSRDSNQVDVLEKRREHHTDTPIELAQAEAREARIGRVANPLDDNRRAAARARQRRTLHKDEISPAEKTAPVTRDEETSGEAEAH